MELSKEVFEYCHSDEVSGEWIGCTVDVALMKDHQDLKRQLKNNTYDIVKDKDAKIEKLEAKVKEYRRTNKNHKNRNSQLNAKIEKLESVLKELHDILKLDRESEMYYEKLHYFEQRIAKQFLETLKQEKSE